MGAYGTELKKADAVIEKLEILDMHCVDKNVKAKILVVGGSALLLLMEYNGKPFRPTRDVDITLMSSTDDAVIRNILAEISMDTVDGIIQMPPSEDFVDQPLKIDIDFEAIEVYVPKVELLACTKLFSKRQKDLNDLLESDLLLLCDKDELITLVEDYKQYFIFIDHPDVNVHQLDNILKQKGII